MNSSTSPIDWLRASQKSIGVAVYGLVEGENIRYVGVTSNPSQRLEQHRAGNTRLKDWIKSCTGMKILCLVETREEAERIEVALISKWGESKQLLNRTVGGAGMIPTSGPMNAPDWQKTVRRRSLTETSRAERKKRNAEIIAMCRAGEQAMEDLEK